MAEPELKIDVEGLNGYPDVDELFASPDDHRNYRWAYLEVAATDPRLPQNVGPFVLPGDIGRISRVRDWIWHYHDGCVLSALRQSPLLVSTDPDTGLMDGWHRLYVAQEKKLDVVPILLFDMRWMKGNGLGRMPRSYLQTEADWAGGG